MRTVARARALAAVAALAVGCGGGADGTAKPAPNLKPRPLTGQTVSQVPLGDAALSRRPGPPLVARQPPEVGGPEKLFQPDNQPSPADCRGVTMMLQKSVYESA